MSPRTRMARSPFIAWALLLLPLALAPRADAADAPGDRAALASAAQRILDDNCLHCHGADRQKGHLRLDTRAGALLGGGRGPAIIPGDPAHGVLMKAVRYADDDLQMPPKAPLAPAQVDTLAEWIAISAPYPTDRGLDLGPSSTAPAVDAPATAGTARPPLIGRVHPLVVHFPIAFLLLTVLAEFLVATRGPRWEPAVKLLLTCGVLGAIVAVTTGTWYADGTMFHHEKMEVTRHEAMGWLTLVLACGTWALLMHADRPRRRTLMRVALLATAACVGLTGHLGGTMVYPDLF